MNEDNQIIEEQVQYTDDNIRHLSDMEHVRTRQACISAVWVMVLCLKTVSMSC